MLGKRAILREASKWYDEAHRLRKECIDLFNILFGVSVKLYKLTPGDEIFTKSVFKPEFMAKIKEAAEKETAKLGQSGVASESAPLAQPSEKETSTAP